METIITYKCPNCDAGLLFDAETQLFKCEFCLSKFTETELNNTKSAQNAKAKAEETEQFRSEILEYRCSACGAEVIAERNTAADFCYYCHNPIVLSDNIRVCVRSLPKLKSVFSIPLGIPMCNIFFITEKSGL